MLLRKLPAQSRTEQVTTAELRRSIHAASTKIEPYNAFYDQPSFGGDVTRSDNPVEQAKRVTHHYSGRLGGSSKGVFSISLEGSLSFPSVSTAVTT